MSFFKKIGKAFKKVVKKVGKTVKKVLPYAAVAAPFIPGVGGLISGAISKVGGMLGSGSSAQNPPQDFVGPMPEQVQVTGQKSAFDPIGAIADVAPAFLGYLGQKQTNVASAQQAQKQMDFQAEQTGTSYQRGVEDMKAAGLNPMLAYSQGGAASGSGASAPVGNELGAGMSSAMQVAMTRAQMAQIGSQIENTQANTAVAEQQVTNMQSDNLYTLARTAHEGGKSSETQQRIAQIALDNALRAATQESDIRLASSSADLRRSEAEREGYLAKASKYELSRAGAWSKFFDSSAGKAYPYAISGAEVANSAAGAVSKLNPFKFGR